MGQSIKHYSEHDVVAGCGIMPVQLACSICLLCVASSVIPVVGFGSAESNCYTVYTMHELELELEQFIWLQSSALSSPAFERDLKFCTKFCTNSSILTLLFALQFKRDSRTVHDIVALLSRAFVPVDNSMYTLSYTFNQVYLL